jgi:hypothetical protein
MTGASGIFLSSRNYSILSEPLARAGMTDSHAGLDDGGAMRNNPQD